MRFLRPAAGKPAPAVEAGVGVGGMSGEAGEGAGDAAEVQTAREGAVEAEAEAGDADPVE